MKIHMRANDKLLFTTLTRSAILAFWLGIIPAGSFAALENAELLENQPMLYTTIPLPLPATSEAHDMVAIDADMHSSDTYPALVVDHTRLSPLSADFSLGTFQHHQNEQPQAAGSEAQNFPVAPETQLASDNNSLATIPNAVLLCISVFIALVAVARRNSV